MAENGRLPASDLAAIAQGELRKDAAASWNTMNQQARSRGVELVPTGSMSSYRSYEEQVYLYEQYLNGTGSLAAVPGTSNHGWGLAVDVATQEMRAMIDSIGKPFGWSKATSDAPSEWWHLKWVEGSWSGADPGTNGDGGADLAKEDMMAIAVGTMSDGRFEVFVEDKNGGVWHAYQDKKGGWAGAEQGKRNAAWYSLGTPGK
jgi:hypothetical protein